MRLLRAPNVALRFKQTNEESPDLGALLLRQATMSAGEWRSSSDAAQVLACYLRCHPCVQEVRYPGLTGDPAYREASSTLRGGFGPQVVVLLGNGNWYSLDADDKTPAYDLVLEAEDLLATLF